MINSKSKVTISIEIDDGKGNPATQVSTYPSLDYAVVLMVEAELIEFYARLNKKGAEALKDSKAAVKKV